MRSSSSSSPSEPADTIATTDTRGGDPTLASVGETELGFDQIFELLSNQRRRYVLQYLQEIDDQPTTSDLAEQIAAWENDKERQQISSDERKRAYVGLYQGHLPKMDDMGVISYNKPRGTIESADNIDQVSAYLDNDERTDRLSTKYYVGLSAASVIVLTSAVFFDAATTAPVITVVVPLSLLAFLLVTVAYYRSEQ